MRIGRLICAGVLRDGRKTRCAGVEIAYFRGQGRQYMRTLANIFKTLSDETRLQMLGLLLKNRELCVCDFVEVLNITQSKASRHLRYLVNAGLLNDRRETIWVYFRLADKPEPAQAAVLKLLPAVLFEKLPGELFDRLEQWSQRKACVSDSCKKQRNR
jgi:ArsR family transcriptional regulator, arsenate/arsenite/antimonite-responsive transcriptional repressor